MSVLDKYNRYTFPLFAASAQFQRMTCLTKLRGCWFCLGALGCGMRVRSEDGQLRVVKWRELVAVNRRVSKQVACLPNAAWLY